MKVISYFYPKEDFDNQNIPTAVSNLTLVGTIAGRSLTPIYTFYQVGTKCFRVGYWNSDKPKELTLDEFIKQTTDNPPELVIQEEKVEVEESSKEEVREEIEDEWETTNEEEDEGVGIL